MSQKARFTTVEIPIIVCIVLLIVVIVASVARHGYRKAATESDGFYAQRISSFTEPLVQDLTDDVFVVSKDAPVRMVPIPLTQLVIVRLSNDEAFWACTNHPEQLAPGDTVRVYSATYPRNSGADDHFLFIEPVRRKQ